MIEDQKDSHTETEDVFSSFFNMQKETIREFAQHFSPLEDKGQFLGFNPSATDIAEFATVTQEIHNVWLDFITENAGFAQGQVNSFDPGQWLAIAQGIAPQIPTQPILDTQKIMVESVEIWKSVFNSLFEQSSEKNDLNRPRFARQDRRFSADEWQSHPAFALLYQTYLMMAEYLRNATKQIEGISPEKQEQLEFAITSLVDAMSPDNFILTNPVVLKRTIETKGQNLLKGMKHLTNDLRKGQLTHTDAKAFELGQNLAATPGKVIYETPLYQLIQYSPTTPTVLKTPLIIFPPWINRYYILDLTEKKSFIKWAVDQGITVFIVSWKSADESLKDIIWDDYIVAQIEVINTVKKRLDVPSVHCIGYCVAGTTLAASLAILAKRRESDCVKSATFFTAQVDFEEAGELKNFINDGQLEMISNLATDGYLDGRYLAATFNSLRGKDLIWNYVVNNYLLGEDYPAFDLLHWNGDVTNLPSKWHSDYLRDLYRDNKLVVPGALMADGTPIDLRLVETPVYIQAGREDHIAPAESVWKATRHFSGQKTFLLAGSGHIAGVINPPSANKYQYWTGNSDAPSLDEFITEAVETKGSWWPHWLHWIERHDLERIEASGKRQPGIKGDKVIEDAPGRYVKTR